MGSLVVQASPTKLRAIAPIGKIGRFDLLGRIAEGGMAEIFLAREAGPHAATRYLVVKRILPNVARDQQVIEMFIHEARLCMTLQHPNICAIYEFGEKDGSFYIAMEWVQGLALRDMLIPGEHGLPVDIVAKITADTASALHRAHSATDEEGAPLGIVHRDVSPENIMVSFDGVIKLLDFGIAKAKTQFQKTQIGTLKGKFAYMSPEQYRGVEIDGRSDVFALGACMYEGLTGVSLFERPTEYETMALIMLDSEVRPVRKVRPEVPEPLDFIVSRALRKDPSERFASADELEQALHGYLSTLSRPIRDADVARFLREKFSEDVQAGPELDRTPLMVPLMQREQGAINPLEKHELDAAVDDIADDFEREARRKRFVIGLLAALIVLGTLAGAFFALRESL